MSKRFLITGGAGFIGSAVCRHLINDTKNDVLVVDKSDLCRQSRLARAGA